MTVGFQQIPTTANTPTFVSVRRIIALSSKSKRHLWDFFPHTRSPRAFGPLSCGKHRFRSSDLMFQNGFDTRGQRLRLRLDVLAVLDDIGGCGLFDLTFIVPCQSSGQALDDDLALLPSRSKRWIRVARTLRRAYSLFSHRLLQACFVCLACFQYVQTVSVDAGRGPQARYRDRHRSSR